MWHDLRMVLLGSFGRQLGSADAPGWAPPFVAPGASGAGPARRALRHDPVVAAAGRSPTKTRQLAGISISARFHWSLVGAVSFIVTDAPPLGVVLF
jgi:hypothetical protein